MGLKELRAAVREALARMESASSAIDNASADTTDEQRSALEATFTAAETDHTRAAASLLRAEGVAEARRNAPVDPENPEREERNGLDGVKVGRTRDLLTYDRRNAGNSYFLDLGRAQLGRGDVDGAKRRLEQHEKEQRDVLDGREKVAELRMNAELEEMLKGLPAPVRRAVESGSLSLVEKRDLTRTDGAGGHFVPPLWLMDEYAAYQRAGRPFVDACRNIPLPSGTDSLSIPRITTGSLTGVQTTDNGAVTEQDMVDNVVTAPVRTIAGQEDIALQLLEQSPLAFDEIVFEDLIADYFLQTDAQAIAGSGSSGQLLGILNVSGINAITYTDASPTVPELYPKIADALNQGETARKAPLTHGWIAPRRFWWASAALDAQSRPFVVPTMQNPMNAPGVSTLGGDTIEDQALLMLAPFRKDHSIPTNLGGSTNEDRIILTRNRDHLFFEGTLRARAMAEVLSGNLTVRLQVYSYCAFTAGRFPGGTSVISGTGLATPTF